MQRGKPLSYLFFIVALLNTSCSVKRNINADLQQSVSSKVIVGYVTSWTKDIPDGALLTHINYAFGHVTDDFTGVRIDNLKRLKSIVDLKKQYPKLKVLLSVGGWGSGRFSEMAATEVNRKKFAKDCLRVIEGFKLDGIDIDWEYPTSKAAKISASPNDTQNYTLLMRDIRSQIGAEKLLTLASSANAKYIDFKAIEPVIDFVNIMTYDMGNPPYHHSGLYRSKYIKELSVDEAVDEHIKAGMPLNKLVLGMPFYGRGTDSIPNFIDYKRIVKLTGFHSKWDDEAKVPFLENANGDMVCTYENPQSIKIKIQYLINRGMLGAMFWEYSGDAEDGILRKTIYNTLKLKPH
jgi:chitinase